MVQRRLICARSRRRIVAPLLSERCIQQYITGDRFRANRSSSVLQCKPKIPSVDSKTNVPTPVYDKMADQGAPRGITSIAELQKDTTVNVMAVCTANPWPVNQSMWKTTLKDTTGQVQITKKDEFGFKSNDVIVARSVRVGEFRGAAELAIEDSSVIEVNPVSDEASILKLWHQNLEIQSHRKREGFTPIANLQKDTSAHVLAVCTRDPWRIGNTMWKVSLRDTTGKVNAMTWSKQFEFKTNDVVAAYSMQVREFKGETELTLVTDSDVDVNPESAEASKLREWYKNEVSQVNENTSLISTLEAGTTANILAVCTSDPVEHTMYRSGRKLWKATLRDTSGFVNATKYDSKFDFGLNDVVEARSVLVRRFMKGVEVVVDNNTVMTINPESEEVKKLKDWYQSQGVRDCAEPSNVTDIKMMEAAGDLLRSNRQIKCDVCNVWCSGNISYQSHITGRPHYSALARKRGANGAGNGTDAGPPLKKRKSASVQEDIKCEICDISVLTKDAYDAHISGARHLKKLKENEVAPDVSSIPHIVEVPGQGYRCAVCNVSMSGKVVVLSHIQGSKHLHKLNAAGSPRTAQNPTQGAPKNMLIECQVCKIFVNSPTVLAQHETSAKHKAKAELAAKGAANQAHQDPQPQPIGTPYDAWDPQG